MYTHVRVLVCMYFLVHTFRYTRVHVCVCLCELLLGSLLILSHTCTHTECELYVYELLLAVSPRSGMCVPVRAVVSSFSTFRVFVCVCLCELLLGVSPRSGCLYVCACASCNLL